VRCTKIDQLCCTSKTLNEKIIILFRLYIRVFYAQHSSHKRDSGKNGIQFENDLLSAGALKKAKAEKK